MDIRTIGGSESKPSDDVKPVAESVSEKPAADNTGSSDASAKPGNGKFIAFIAIDVLLLIVMIVVIIGFTTAEYLRTARRTVADQFKDIRGKVSNTTKYHEIAAANEKLRQERAAELAELNKSIAENEEQRLQAQAKMIAEDAKYADMEVVVATARPKERYTFDPQFKAGYYSNVSTRAYPESDKAFMEKFNALTKDGVLFNDM